MLKLFKEKFSGRKNLRENCSFDLTKEGFQRRYEIDIQEGMENVFELFKKTGVGVNIAHPSQ